MSRTPHLAARLQGLTTTIFAEMSALAVAHDAVNLGQGFPDFDPPREITDAAIAAIGAGANQYAPGPGLPTLRHAVARHQQRFQGQDLDPDTEVTITAGATEAIAAAIIAVCEVGDEVVVIEPTYDSYVANIAMAGAVPRAVPLAAPDFALDVDRLAAAIGPRTRVILINSPHNPTGAVLGDAELSAIAELCVRHDLIAITDEVYEHLTYGVAHRTLATYPGMAERTILVSSAGKTFSVTGWKIGWICAAPALTTAVRLTKQYLTFTNGTPFQHAVAAALDLDDAFFDTTRMEYLARRDRLVDGLRDVGFTVTPPSGSYFVCVDVADVGWRDDVAFCHWLPEAVGVAAVPCSVFHLDPADGRGVVRFAFCKTDALLDDGIARLHRLADAPVPAGR